MDVMHHFSENIHLHSQALCRGPPGRLHSEIQWLLAMKTRRWGLNRDIARNETCCPTTVVGWIVKIPKKMRCFEAIINERFVGVLQRMLIHSRYVIKDPHVVAKIETGTGLGRW